MSKAAFSILTILLLVLLNTADAHARMIIQTGIASPQSESDYRNVERLRQRALRDARELALEAVLGTEISSERASLDYSRQTYRGKDGQTTESWKQQSAWHRNAKTRLRGHVKVVEIIREWWEDENYLVKAKLEVLPPDQQAQQATVGSYWRQIGRPGLALDARASRNGSDWWDNASFRSYLLEEMKHQELETRNSDSARYHIRVWQKADNSYLPEYGTWKSLCEIAFSVIDRETAQNRAEQRVKAGPAAGFSEKEAEDNCLGKASKPLSRAMLEDLLALFNNEWLNGRDFTVQISGIPAARATQARQLINEAFAVVDTTSPNYQENRLKLSVTFKGQPTELAESLRLALDEAGMKIQIQELRDNHITYTWQGTED